MKCAAVKIKHSDVTMIKIFAKVFDFISVTYINAMGKLVRAIIAKTISNISPIITDETINRILRVNI